MYPRYPRPSLDCPTLLLVEDNPPDARMVRLMIEASTGARFHVVEAGTLGAALAVLESVAVDAVLLDLGLPDSTGISIWVRVPIPVESGIWVRVPIPIPDSTGIGTLTQMLARMRSVPIVVLT